MSTRGRILTVPVGERLVTETCYSCGVLFAMAEDFFDRRQRDQKTFYCPSGHSQAYVGKTDTQKLEESRARETALRDQLDAAVREAEAQRVELARTRQRIANGVCPCCSRSFDNVRRHIASQHPDFKAPPVAPFKCSCGRRFDTFRGLRVHQGYARPDGWERQTSRYWQHLTVGASS